MINLKDITGSKVKKFFGATRASFGYHNHNKTGGNFGFNLIFEREGKVHCGCGVYTQDRSIYQIVGHYDNNGNVYSLRFCEGWSAGAGNLEDLTLEEFLNFAKKYIADHEAERVRKLTEEKLNQFNQPVA